MIISSEQQKFRLNKLMKRVIIADVRSHISEGIIKGHGYAVASNYLEIFRDSTEVKVAGGPAYSRKYGEAAIDLPYDTEDTRPTWLNKLRIMQNMRRLFRICRQDTIVIQSSGVVTALIGIALFKRPETQVFMILYNEAALSSRLKRFFFRLAKDKISGVLCPTERVGKAHGLPYCVVPDYIYCGDGESNGVKQVGYADKRYDFCMVGLIWRDKGMVEAARHLAGTSYKVLIAGALSGEAGLEQDLREACHGARNIDLRLGYLDAEAYDEAIRNSRYCILNYSGAYSHHSSGVVFDILFRGTPVIGSSCSTLRFIGEYGIGRLFRDVREFEPASVLQEEQHSRFLANLSTYYAHHRACKDKLIRYIVSENGEC